MADLIATSLSRHSSNARGDSKDAIHYNLIHGISSNSSNALGDSKDVIQCNLVHKNSSVYIQEKRVVDKRRYDLINGLKIKHLNTLKELNRNQKQTIKS